MSDDRHVRRAGLIMELAAKFIRSETNSNPMITVTSVDLSPDMRHAIIFITTIPNEGEQEALIFLKETVRKFGITSKTRPYETNTSSRFYD